MNWLLIAAVAAFVVMNIGWCLCVLTLRTTIRKLEDTIVEMHETQRFYKDTQQREATSEAPR